MEPCSLLSAAGVLSHEAGPNLPRFNTSGPRGEAARERGKVREDMAHRKGQPASGAADAARLRQRGMSWTELN